MNVQLAPRALPAWHPSPATPAGANTDPRRDYIDGFLSPLQKKLPKPSRRSRHRVNQKY